MENPAAPLKKFCQKFSQPSPICNNLRLSLSPTARSGNINPERVGLGLVDDNMKLDAPHESHLTLREFLVPAGGGWVSPLTGWAVLQVRKGTGYHLLPQTNQALETGSVLLLAEGAKGSIRASQLSELTVHGFNIMPARLTGLITLSEQSSLDLAAARKESLIRIFPPLSPLALKLGELQAEQNQGGLPFRLKLLQFFVEMIGDELERTAVNEESTAVSSRLQLFLKQTPASELLEMNFNELAKQTRCTTRHLSRVFQQLVGMTFREKRAELRLTRARELLATGNSKVVDVALESGYKSLSLFNLMFARRYGTSPGKWRQKNGNQKKLVPARLQRGRLYKN